MSISMGTQRKRSEKKHRDTAEGKVNLDQKSPLLKTRGTRTNQSAPHSGDATCLPKHVMTQRWLQLRNLERTCWYWRSRCRIFHEELLKSLLALCNISLADHLLLDCSCDHCLCSDHTLLVRRRVCKTESSPGEGGTADFALAIRNPSTRRFACGLLSPKAEMAVSNSWTSARAFAAAVSGGLLGCRKSGGLLARLRLTPLSGLVNAECLFR